MKSRSGSTIRTTILSTLILISLGLAACNHDASAKGSATLTPLQSQGRFVFKSTCSSCHATSGDTVIVGPSLAGIANRAGERVRGMDAEDYIRQSIRDPRAYTVDGFPEDIMPTSFGDQLSQEQIEALTAYLLTLEY